LRIPLGMIVLLVISVLVFFGVAHRVLDRLRLSDRAALAMIAALIVGGLINIPLPAGLRMEASLNIGGAVVPFILAGYLFIRTSTQEKFRAIAGVAATAVAVYLTGVLLGSEPGRMMLDPLYVFPVVAGVVAYLIGRSRRGAFIAATMGILVVDVITYVQLVSTKTPGTVSIGGGGAFDAVVISGLLAVLLAEFIGESREWLQRGPLAVNRSPALLKRLRPVSDDGSKKTEAGNKTDDGKMADDQTE